MEKNITDILSHRFTKDKLSILLSFLFAIFSQQLIFKTPASLKRKNIIRIQYR